MKSEKAMLEKRYIRRILMWTDGNMKIVLMRMPHKVQSLEISVAGEGTRDGQEFVFTSIRWCVDKPSKCLIMTTRKSMTANDSKWS